MPTYFGPAIILTGPGFGPQRIGRGEGKPLVMSVIESGGVPAVINVQGYDRPYPPVNVGANGSAYNDE